MTKKKQAEVQDLNIQTNNFRAELQTKCDQLDMEVKKFPEAKAALDGQILNLSQTIVSKQDVEKQLATAAAQV